MAVPEPGVCELWVLLVRLSRDGVASTTEAVRGAQRLCVSRPQKAHAVHLGPNSLATSLPQGLRPMSVAAGAWRGPLKDMETGGQFQNIA